MMAEEILNQLFYNLSHEAGFSSQNRLYKAAKSQDSSITLKQVREWLKKQLTYTLHKPARKRFKRNSIIVSAIDEQWQADLVDMQAFSKDNDGYKYILTVIDLFSKYAWVIPIKDKSAFNVKKALSSIMEDRVPQKLQTDQGKEFTNKTVGDFLNECGVVFFTSHNQDIKCAVVERFNRTLKSRMWKYFTFKGSRRYLDVLPQLIKSYNNSYHRTIKMKPVQVTEENTSKVFRNSYGVDRIRDLRQNVIPLPKGTTVRRKYKLGAFDKGYYPLWTDQVYEVKRANVSQEKPAYTLNENAERLYPEDIQEVTADVYRVEKILARRKRRGQLEYLIKWLNYPDSYNSWEPSGNVINL